MPYQTALWRTKGAQLCGHFGQHLPPTGEVSDSLTIAMVRASSQDLYIAPKMGVERKLPVAEYLCPN